MKMATADHSKLKPVHAQYTKALPTTKSRKGSWVFFRQIIWSSDWLDGSRNTGRPRRLSVRPYPYVPYVPFIR